jgi:hypothetical protein
VFSCINARIAGDLRARRKRAAGNGAVRAAIGASLS